MDLRNDLLRTLKVSRGENRTTVKRTITNLTGTCSESWEKISITDKNNSYTPKFQEISQRGANFKEH